MNDISVDVNSWSEAYRRSLAPLLRLQQSGFGALDRFARCQYGVGADFLEWSLGLSQAALAAQGPADLLAKGALLSVKLREQLQCRIQELTKTGPVEASAIPAIAVPAVAATAAPLPAPTAAVALTLVPTAGERIPARKAAPLGVRDNGKPKGRHKT